MVYSVNERGSERSNITVLKVEGSQASFAARYDRFSLAFPSFSVAGFVEELLKVILRFIDHNWIGFQFGTVSNWNWIGIRLDEPHKDWIGRGSSEKDWIGTGLDGYGFK